MSYEIIYSKDLADLQKQGAVMVEKGWLPSGGVVPLSTTNLGMILTQVFFKPTLPMQKVDGDKLPLDGKLEIKTD